MSSLAFKFLGRTSIRAVLNRFILGDTSELTYATLVEGVGDGRYAEHAARSVLSRHVMSHPSFYLVTAADLFQSADQPQRRELRAGVEERRGGAGPAAGASQRRPDFQALHRARAGASRKCSHPLAQPAPLFRGLNSQRMARCSSAA